MSPDQIASIAIGISAALIYGFAAYQIVTGKTQGPLDGISCPFLKNKTNES